MKTMPLFIAFSLLALPSLHAEQPTAAQQSQAAYQQALKAEAAGNAAAAKSAYEKALRLNPRHGNARHRLGQLKLNYEKIEAKGRKMAFSAVVIPEFKMDEANFSEALQALSQLSEEASEKQIAPNFIIQDPSNRLSDRKITLVMKSAPAGGILDYLLEMAGAKARFDQHAIVIMPK